MRYILLILFFAALLIPQFPDNPQAASSKPKRSPIVGFEANKNTTPIMDTDVFDEAKYIEQTGSDSTAANAKRKEHEAVLTREFMEGFNHEKECDGIVLQSEGDNKPDYALQIIVDSHDTPGQKPVWNWILRDVRTNKLLPVGFNDTGKQAAQGICSEVWKLAKM